MCLENCDTSCLGVWSSSDVGPGAAKPQGQVEHVHEGQNQLDDTIPIASGRQAA